MSNNTNEQIFLEMLAASITKRHSLDNADLVSAYLDGEDDAYEVICERGDDCYDFCREHYESAESDLVLALLSYLAEQGTLLHPSDLVERNWNHYGLTVFEAGDGNEYAVGTDEECDSAVVENVRQSLWAFSPYFLSHQTDLPEEVFTALSEQCEGANDAIEKLVEKCVEGGVEALAEEAANCDGRGHFMSSYDGNEGEVCFKKDGEDFYDYFYIYRTN